MFRWTREPDERNRLLQGLMDSREEIREEERTGERHVLRLLCFDFGGGTIDLAAIEVELKTFADVIRMRIRLQGSDSLAYGGDHVTLAVFRILKRRLAMAASDPERFAGASPAAQTAATGHEDGAGSALFLLPSHGRRMSLPLHGSHRGGAELIRERWDDLSSRIADELLPEELEDAVDSVFPTRFRRSAEEPVSPAAKRACGWLWERAERLQRETFREASRHGGGPGLGRPDDDTIRGGLAVADVPQEILGGRRVGLEDLRVEVSVGEIYRAIHRPIEEAVARARRLTGDGRIDRIVLTGQSSWIPLVRRLLVRPRGDGGFGLAPGKVEFDGRNAKAVVSKGACLLRVLRDTIVGFDVDVSDFKANLLADAYYKSPVDGARTLFAAGQIHDLAFVEEAPDPPSFPRHPAVFHGGADRLLGRFDFDSECEPLPPFEEHAERTARRLGLESFPAHPDLVRARGQDRVEAARSVGAMRDWPERAIVSWIERRTMVGTEERPLYRYHPTRNRNVLAVRDRGGDDERLLALEVDDRAQARVPPAQSPCCGAH